MEYITAFSKDLIEQLDKEYPRPLYSPNGTSFEEFLMKSGERRLVETLLLKLQRTEEKGLYYV